MADYWNHNAAYHPWLMSIAEGHRGDVLDVGCGDGLLVQRLAPVSRSVTGIDSDPAALQRARDRLSVDDRVAVHETTFEAYDPGVARFDLITFVATIHHMDLRASLLRARDLLRPSGEIAIVGLSANKTLRDWIWSGLCLPAVRIGSKLNHETRDIGVAVADPREDLGEIRRVAHEVLPGADVRRALYYRYLLKWRRTVGSA
ncbi:SAM-dependent methyltransferase [Mycobacterium sp. ITM-2017-0098]|nr:SAM-dependent methyltransferase [Mycobacterium sp. ITM-2017-0098]